MGLLQRFENRLEAVVSGAFARAFRSSVQPVELAAALQREVDNNAQVLNRERRLAPNEFHIELSPGDYGRLAPYSASLVEELVDVLREHAQQQAYVFTGPLRISFEEADDLGTGRFRVRSRAAASVAVAPELLIEPEVPSAPLAPPAPTAPPTPAPPEVIDPTFTAPSPPEDAATGEPPADDTASEDTSDADDLAPAPVEPPPPRPETKAYLEVNGIRQVLSPPGLIIGRGPDAGLRINDPGVSRSHAEIQVLRGIERPTVTIVDLGSTNGTHVNGYRIERAALTEGSEVSIGNTVLTIRFDTVPAGDHEAEDAQ